MVNPLEEKGAHRNADIQSPPVFSSMIINVQLYKVLVPVALTRPISADRERPIQLQAQPESRYIRLFSFDEEPVVHLPGSLPRLCVSKL